MLRIDAVRRRLWHTRLRVPVLLLMFYSITRLVNLITWITLYATDHDTLHSIAVLAYIAFVSLGFIVFFGICSPLLYLAYAFASEMSPSARRHATSLALGISFLVHDFPLTWLEIHMVWYNGWSTVLQGISFVLTLVCFVIGFMTTWMYYTWNMSKLLQIHFGDAAAAATAALRSNTRIVRRIVAKPRRSGTV